MNCTEISTLAPLYFTGELDPARRNEFAAHVKSCAACTRELRQQEALDALLRTSVLAEPLESAPLERRLRNRIAREARSKRVSSRWVSSRRISPRWMVAAAGVAAVMLIAASGYRMMFSSRALPYSPPVYAAAAHDHLIEIVEHQPRKWFTDRVSIEELAGEQGFSKGSIAAIVAAGYRLEQGKVCRLDGFVFLHLVLANEAGNLSIFLRRLDVAEPDSNAKRVLATAIGSEHLVGFADTQSRGLVVTEQSGDAASRLAKLAASVL